MKNAFMKFFGVVIALTMCVGVYAQDNNDAVENRDANENHQGPRRLGPGGPSGGHRYDERHDKSGDLVLQALIKEVVPKFQQFVYEDAETGKTMEYNLFVPENYDPSQKYPLLLFIGDATTAHREVEAPLTQGYGGIIWAAEADQAKHPSFVLVPQYKTLTVNDDFEMSYEVEMTIRLVKYICSQWSVDAKRLYTTGQSMGGMMSMCFNIYHPKFFAASLYAGCQWDTNLMAGFADDSFIYGVGGGDEKAHGGMDGLRAVLEAKGKEISSAEWSAKLPQEEQEANMKALLAEGNNVNFFVFTKGTVMPESGEGIEHLWSFDYIYKIDAARDWIFEQHLDAEPEWVNEKPEAPKASEEHPWEKHEGEANADHPWHNKDGEANADHPWHKDGEHHGPQGGPDPRHDKSGDAVLQALLAETVDKFQQLVYNDAETGKPLEYNLFIPENYDPSQKYPLILFIGDASTAHQDVLVPLKQGYGGVIWASAAEQAKHPCFVVVPQYPTVPVDDYGHAGEECDMTIRLIQSLCEQYSVDTKRLYTTGQSMGGMMSMYFNITHPKFFAASLYAGCQWIVSTMASFANDSFIYGVAGGDVRASAEMQNLRELLESNGKHVSFTEWSAKLPQEEQEANMQALLDEGNTVNFFMFTKGTVMPESGVGMEHMWSFDYIYKLEPARDWIFAQHLD